MAEHDPRLDNPNICGITHQTARHEWVCIAEPHDSTKQRSDQPNHRGEWPRHMRHHFVNKHPWRPEE